MTFKKSLLLIVTYIFLFGVFATLVIVYSETKLRTLLLFANLFSLLVPIAVRTVQGKLDLFEPLVVANISLFFMFFGRPLADLITGQTVHMGYTIMTTFDNALFLSWVGILCFQIGYFSPLMRYLANCLPYPPTFQPGTAALSAWLFTGLGAMLFALFLYTQGGFKIFLYLIEGRQPSNNDLFLNSTGYLYNGILMWGPASLIFFAIAVVEKRIHMLFPFGLLILPLLVLYGSRGARSHLLPLVISIPVFWYLWKHRRPSFKNVFFSVFIGLVILGWIREFRDIETKDRMIDHLKITLSSPVATIGDLLISPDVEMFDSLANELLVVPKTMPFMHGATITDIFIRAIPRTLYPNKRMESNDILVSTLWPAHYAISRAAPCFSVIGVFYADSGFITVVFGMFLLGALLASFWRWFQEHSYSIMAQLVYSMGLPFVVILMRGNIPDTLARMFFYFSPLIMLLLYKRLCIRVGREPLIGSVGPEKAFIYKKFIKYK